MPEIGEFVVDVDDFRTGIRDAFNARDIGRDFDISAVSDVFEIDGGVEGWSRVADVND